ncbi:MAG: PspC domain-containing protein [Bacteroidales bacterium]|nr:PspC domain-containing protein [Bacteroidales bacterium]
MKKTVSAAIGSTNFIIDEDAYARLDSYLAAFRAKLHEGADTQEVMTDLENRIAELAGAKLGGENRVITLSLIDEIISSIGMPDGTSYRRESQEATSEATKSEPVVHKFFRDRDHRSIGGVCSGLAAYFNLDVTLVRVAFILLFLFGSTGFWLYIVLWIIAPTANTPTEKCQLRGIEPSFENLSKFTTSK